WPPLIHVYAAEVRAGRFGGHPADNRAADDLGVVRLELVAEDAEPARLQPVDVPEIAAAAVLLEPQHEQVVAATVDARSGILLGQQPDIAAIIWWPIALQQ